MVHVANTLSWHETRVSRPFDGAQTRIQVPPAQARLAGCARSSAPAAQGGDLCKRLLLALASRTAVSHCGNAQVKHWILGAQADAHETPRRREYYLPRGCWLAAVQVLVVWECQLRSPIDVLEMIRGFLERRSREDLRCPATLVRAGNGSNPGSSRRQIGPRPVGYLRDVPPHTRSTEDHHTDSVDPPARHRRLLSAPFSHSLPCYSKIAPGP